MGMFAGKIGLVMGVANDRSIAWAISPHFSPPLLKKGGLLWHKLFC